MTNALAQQRNALKGKVVGVGSGGNQLRENNHQWIDDRTKLKATEVPPYRYKAFEIWCESCVICGATGKIHVHHIDGNRLNARYDNLVPLCVSHHRKIHKRRKQGKEELTEGLFKLWPEGRIKIAEKTGELLEQGQSDLKGYQAVSQGQRLEGEITLPRGRDTVTGENIVCSTDIVHQEAVEASDKEPKR